MFFANKVHGVINVFLIDNIIITLFYLICCKYSLNLFFFLS